MSNCCVVAGRETKVFTIKDMQAKYMDLLWPGLANPSVKRATTNLLWISEKRQ